MRNTIKLLLTAAMLVVTTHASAWGVENDPISGGDYKRETAMTQGEVFEATVVQVRKVNIQSTDYARNAGTVAGGAIGGIAGASIGKKTATKTVGGILGAVIGAGVGQAIGESVSDRDAGEVVLRESTGKLIYVVQQDGLSFQPGEKVLLMKSSSGWNSNIRVARLTAQ